MNMWPLSIELVSTPGSGQFLSNVGSGFWLEITTGIGAILVTILFQCCKAGGRRRRALTLRNAVYMAIFLYAFVRSLLLLKVSFPDFSPPVARDGCMAFHSPCRYCTVLAFFLMCRFQV